MSARNKTTVAAAAEPSKEQKTYSFKAVFIVVEHGSATEVGEALTAMGIDNRMYFSGKGTANSDLMSILGLGDLRKDIILTILTPKRAADAIEAVRALDWLNGVIFSVRLNSIGGRKTLKILQGD